MTNSNEPKDIRLGGKPTLSSSNGAIPYLDFTKSNLADEGKLWHQQYTIYICAQCLENVSDHRHVAILLHYLGPHELQIFNSFGLELEAVKCGKLIGAFCDYCSPRKNLTIERFNFFTRCQLHVSLSVGFGHDIISNKCSYKNIRTLWRKPWKWCRHLIKLRKMLSCSKRVNTFIKCSSYDPGPRYTGREGRSWNRQVRRQTCSTSKPVHCDKCSLQHLHGKCLAYGQ
ncbi:hypothetical protein PR048_013573, partial [Dryococelus australis]